MADFTSSLRTIVTRKDHHCVCFDIYCESGYCIYDIPDIFQDSVMQAGEKNGVIPKGTECYFWSGMKDGEWFTSYAFKGMHDFICHMDWFED